MLVYCCVEPLFPPHSFRIPGRGGAETLTLVLLLVGGKKGFGRRRGLGNADWTEVLPAVALLKD